jgi:uncharacterized protein YjcR
MGRNKIQFDDTKALKMYRAGKKDYEIARAVGVSASTILKWRRNNNLAPTHRHSAVSELNKTKLEVIKLKTQINKLTEATNPYIIALTDEQKGLYSYIHIKKAIDGIMFSEHDFRMAVGISPVRLNDIQQKEQTEMYTYISAERHKCRMV